MTRSPVAGIASFARHATLIGALAALNWYVLEMPVPFESRLAAVSARPSHELPALPDRPIHQPLLATQFQEVSKRPLFHPDRRPFVREVDAAAPAVAPAATLSGLALVGIMLDHSGGKRALIRSADVPAEWVTIGASINGWVVRAIDTGGSVVLEARGRRASLDLYRQP